MANIADMSYDEIELEIIELSNKLNDAINDGKAYAIISLRSRISDLEQALNDF